MCGIAGLSCLPGHRPDQAALARMSQAIFHRGPDGEGRLDLAGAALRHRRLSIVDIAGGAQPFRLGAAALIANGEIYNDPAIRRRFPATCFQTHSDCEPPLHLWLQDGAGYTHELRGMYAIAIVENEQGRHEMVLARDPFGIKPLYIAAYEGGIAFASEAQALLAGGFGRRSVREGARDELMQLQFTTGQDTIFEGIRRLLPGETLRIVDGRIVESRRRHVLHEARDTVPAGLTDMDALARLDTALLDSVEAHLRADVPLGLFLSGGIDSSVILAAAHRLGLPHPKTWTARFDAGAADESAQAAALAASVGAEHHVLTVTEDMVWRDLPAIVACMDDPAADYAIIPTWFLAREARKDVTVILSGEGGDELFAGYGRYRRVMKPWWKGGRAPYRSGAFGRRFPQRGRQWRHGIAMTELALGLSGLEAAQALDIAEWLPNDLLLKLDRCLMAHSLEGRTPLLDPVVAKAIWSLPGTFKVRDGYGKWLLRRWLQDALPQARPFAPKQGFTVPMGPWIEKQAQRLGPLVARQPCIRAMMPEQDVERLFARASQRGVARQAWTLLFYALWHRHHIEGVPVDGNTFETLSRAS
ncbi:asparagine synthase (glutamine-hydrolyzing) [Gluconobacter albidus]|uniref:asparagine synthase (glutamine-hydrolyzing) n=1 Tax=Gluconobacter albidus TaxID=318683 RepID=A0AAW3QWU3_9PROT|nr:asparagine synthase (glutamine-hydrolyzing) [Gluconobacter albidus]KXV37537.1 asparagine synthase [Gluconobacter albidus]GBQ92309.1 asparagine synthetase [Gluconobacter albidus NBRC 3250]GLQ68180.1 asparagine synthetase B [Gluconobacter albidus]